MVEDAEKLKHWLNCGFKKWTIVLAIPADICYNKGHNPVCTERLSKEDIYFEWQEGCVESQRGEISLVSFSNSQRMEVNSS